MRLDTPSAVPVAGASLATQRRFDFAADGALRQIPVTINDRCEGHIHTAVMAVNEDEAYDLADIAAAEMGCRHVIEISVGVHE